MFPYSTAAFPLRRSAVALVVGALCLLGAAVPAAAAVRHVASSGSDAAACTRSAPCDSFAKAYGVATDGDVVELSAGAYPAQRLPAGTKAVTFRGARAAKVRELDNSADNVTFDGVDVDAGHSKTTGFENHGASNVTFKNGRIGNVTDEKGALVSGSDFTFDNVVFHDVRVTAPEVHNECVYAIGVPGMTVRNSTFSECATMDLFFTYGSWWSPLPPAYGDVTLENNVFGHTTTDTPGEWHYYSLDVGDTGPGGGNLSGWVVRNNTFEIAANISRDAGTGSRWVGNLGSWDCIPGVTYRRNVGDRCAASDKAVSPSASTRTSTAAFGWNNPNAHDFRLKLGSPAIDAGDPGDAPAGDRDGLARDARPDAGAYELGATRPVGLGGPGTGAPGSGSPEGAKPTGGPLIRSARLRPRTICVRRRRTCPPTARLRLRVSAPARVSVRVERLRRGRKPRRTQAFALPVRARHTAKVRARRLGRGRYRVVLTAQDAAGRRSKAKRLKLRVR